MATPVQTLLPAAAGQSAAEDAADRPDTYRLLPGN
jgi:hypothetical protein